ncbi:DNA polymerase III subunit gamma/tau [Synoicihabitans lomoniglobus]|uniref:DNA polymerase III subunit gamma/tau n=1 Tax=Synoicihabitans lomoniglobus TaxID=2909285 RepID=A0AAF0I2Y6_9BACT|nr:DNA polymerase III subunit gamma/tau [Opitutaceae bacterium LMO-M01]WED66807.1 DNA polymerase III subunit gamma/tau [Opitutaceae bacterium LMO-M01]
MPALTWPDSLQGTPAVAVIERAIERERLSHSLLITGAEYETLVAVSLAIADRLLYPPHGAAPAVRFAPNDHADCHNLRPEGKARFIKADVMRKFIGKLSVSAATGDHKVGIVHEADRMNVATSNIFLKTLEEPPANTTLLVLTTRPYALLPTIRSRCLNFRFPSAEVGYLPDGWRAWISDYQAWLGRLSAGVTDRGAAADAIFSAYGLTARFGVILDAATSEAWKEQKTDLPSDLADDEKVAIETGLSNGLRLKLFAGIEHATRDFALEHISTGDESFRRAFTGAIEKLEHSVGLLRVNLNAQTALESFMLASLRLWAARS